MKNENLNKLAKKVIKQSMKQVITANSRLLDKDDIKEETKVRIMLPFTYEDNENDPKKPIMNEKMRQELLAILKIFDEIFDEVYEEYIEKKLEEVKESPKEELTMQELSENVRNSSLKLSEITRKVNKQLPRKMVEELKISEQKNTENRENIEKKKELDVITMYHGEWYKNAPESKKGDIER